MDNRLIDLHVHSTASDGTLSPSEVVSLAAELKLSAIALTDHDTTAGIHEAEKAAAKAGIELIPGIELSCSYDEREIHILGLYIDPDDSYLNSILRKFRYNRDNRNFKMIERLQEKGFKININDITSSFPDCVLTRAHIARYLVDTHQVGSLDIVFSKYIGDGCPCYVQRDKITPFEAVSLIESAGGMAFLAHPLLYKLEMPQLDKLVADLAGCGLAGLEAVYSTHFGKNEQNMRALAAKYGLLISGGSDFHGTNKPYIHLGSGKGNLAISYSILENIKERAGVLQHC